MADVTMVGSGIFLRGSIRGEGDLEIRGRVEGDIEIVGEVIIADGALIKADVTARRITVRGAVLGNLTGEDGVRLEGGARVVGDVRGASIGISDGALLRGNVQTGQGEERARPRATQARAVAKPPARVEVRKARRSAPPSGLHRPQRCGAQSRSDAGRRRALGPPCSRRPRDSRKGPGLPCASGTMSDTKSRLIALLTERSFERKKVILASGRESDFIDCKQTILTAEGHALVGELMFRALDAAPQLPGGRRGRARGMPLASAVSLVSFQQGRPLAALYVRKEQKDHGSKRLVEGDRAIVPGMPVVVLEDVITTGGSTLKAVEKLSAAGVRVVGVVALVDRLEGGADAIRAAGLPRVSHRQPARFHPRRLITPRTRRASHRIAHLHLAPSIPPNTYTRRGFAR